MTQKEKGKKRQEVRYTKPGPAAWIKVYNSDTTYKEGGEFAVDLFLTPEHAQEEIDVYDKIVADTVANEGGKASPDVQYKLVSDCSQKYLDKLSSTGLDIDPAWYLLKFRVDHKVTPKKGNPFENEVKVVDKAGKDLPEGKDSIGNGSVIRVAYEPYGWAVSGKVGCKMRLKAIQVLNVIPYSNNSIEFGTAEEEDIAF
tara:strand:+ start:137 stop:733 length:597 start_codon:yes stop_codon:yes gene_type:complete